MAPRQDHQLLSHRRERGFNDRVHPKGERHRCVRIRRSAWVPCQPRAAFGSRVLIASAHERRFEGTDVSKRGEPTKAGAGTAASDSRGE